MPITALSIPAGHDYPVTARQTLALTRESTLTHGRSDRPGDIARRMNRVTPEDLADLALTEHGLDLENLLTSTPSPAVPDELAGRFHGAYLPL